MGASASHENLHLDRPRRRMTISSTVSKNKSLKSKKKRAGSVPPPVLLTALKSLPSDDVVPSPYDVRQMMHQELQRRNTVAEPQTPSVSSSQQTSPTAEPRYRKRAETIQTHLKLSPQLSRSSSTSEDSGIDRRLSVDEEPPLEPESPPKKESKKKKSLVKRISRARSKSLGFLFGEKPAAPLFGNSYLNREWEIVTVKEMCRRLSLDEIDHIELPIPDGAESSQILDELMIRQVMEILPARAEGYPWVNIYNSEKHGFSLATLYRKMAEFDEDMSPILLIIRDTHEHVFGAIVSSAIRPQEGYYGTGDSCLLWRFTGEVPHTRELRQYTWTGENQFFVNATKENLSFGSGGGHQGLWLDADLNHGRSQRCETFDNEPLAGDKEDFIVQFCEAYGFRM